MDSQGQTTSMEQGAVPDEATTSTPAGPSVTTTAQEQPSSHTDPRFTIELEFVLSLGNPYYISHLAATYPYLFGTSNDASGNSLTDDPDAVESTESKAFAAYLEYLYVYWRRPEYMQFLSHPVSSLRSLRLLQEPSFRHNVIKPHVIEALVRLGMPTEQAPQVGTESQHDG